ncbi:hypothetical protein ACFRCW_42190 [Streptomyces sp. NPDC056653]|uniref:hypothetical protein n=1 Tax=Streptomyces sp. NPDC056653 TaxID=3345894 RepID=UPI0036773274
MAYDLLRSLGLTTVFGKPGSAEQRFLQEFPDDFACVLALREPSVIADNADAGPADRDGPAAVLNHEAPIPRQATQPNAPSSPAFPVLI